MRNLLEYPITDAEICACLKQIAEEIDKGEIACGDMRAVLLMTAADIISVRKFGSVARAAKLDAVAKAAAACIHDDRHCGGSVSYQMLTQRRIDLADALKALKE